MKLKMSITILGIIIISIFSQTIAVGQSTIHLVNPNLKGFYPDSGIVQEAVFLFKHVSNQVY
jgi:hypothetical protein